MDVKRTLVLILAAIPTGIAVGAVDALFGRVLLYLGAVRDAHVMWLVPFLGLVGAAMAWAYKHYGKGCESGMGMVFEAGHGERGEIPLRLVPFVMCATWLTHLFGGSAGREGVAVQLGAAISHRVGRLLRIEDAPRLMLITGIAAGFAGLFRTPFAATAFAIEVLTAGRLEHRALLPAGTAALCASLTSGLLGLEKFTFAVTELPVWDAALLIELAGLGLAGAAFTFLLKWCKKRGADEAQRPRSAHICDGYRALRRAAGALEGPVLRPRHESHKRRSRGREGVRLGLGGKARPDGADALGGVSGRGSHAALFDRREPGRRAGGTLGPACGVLRRAGLRGGVRLGDEYADSARPHSGGGLRLALRPLRAHNLRPGLCRERKPLHLRGPAAQPLTLCTAMPRARRFAVSGCSMSEPSRSDIF